MSDWTIVTDSAGKLVGAVQGHSLTQKHGNVEATVSFDQGHRLHKVNVGEDLTKITDPAEFSARLLKHLPKG